MNGRWTRQMFERRIIIIWAYLAGYAYALCPYYLLLPRPAVIVYGGVTGRHASDANKAASQCGRWLLLAHFRPSFSLRAWAGLLHCIYIYAVYLGPWFAFFFFLFLWLLGLLDSLHGGVHLSVSETKTRPNPTIELGRQPGPLFNFVQNKDLV